ncbi:hypothetical protein J6590_014553 [Homalodisca vitripennis]|nr:hypothetical protein J6590_014553 [Homalodisca vitripennis]
MENEVKQRTQRNRRRERAQRMLAQKRENKVKNGGADSGEDESPTREKPQRPPPPSRRKKSKDPMFEEDVIDGFAILSFKTYEDLEPRYSRVRYGTVSVHGDAAAITAVLISRLISGQSSGFLCLPIGNAFHNFLRATSITQHSLHFLCPHSPSRPAIVVLVGLLWGAKLVLCPIETDEF